MPAERTDSLEALLRESAMTYGSVQLFRDRDGWHAAVTHYEPGKVGALHTGRSVTDCDPVTALRVALLEDDRRSRDLSRRYAQAAKGAPVQIDIEEAIAAAGGDDGPCCLICEDGGCDACRSDELEDLLG